MMKHVMWVLAVVVLPTAATAQIIEQRVWTFGTPVTVVNATEDRQPMDVSVAGEVRAYRFILRPDDPPWRKSFGNGLVLLTRNEQLAISAQTCDGVVERTLEPPAWASDDRVAGPAAFSLGFLDGNPSEETVKGRVGRIKFFLDHKQTLGRKELKRDLDLWLKIAKRYGLRATVADCASRGSAAGTTVGVWYGASQAYTLFIRGSRNRGYYITVNY